MKKFKTAIDDFIFHCRFEKNLSQQTIKSYNIDIKQFVCFLKENNYSHYLNKIDKTIIKKYLQNLSDKKPKTVKRKIATIKALFNFLEFEDEIKINPFRKIRIQIKEPILLPLVMNIKEIKEIFRIIYLTKKEKSNINSYSYHEIVRVIAVFELLFATGIRVSELCKLKEKNIDLYSGFMCVNGKGNKERIIQICNKETIYSLKEYYKLFKDKIRPTGFFFINRINNPLSEQSVRFMIKKYVQKAGLKKNITPHTFRHTLATLLLEEDVDITYIQLL